MKDVFGKGTALRMIVAVPQGSPGAMLNYDVFTPTTVIPANDPRR
jgi:hypothetical protein